MKSVIGQLLKKGFVPVRILFKILSNTQCGRNKVVLCTYFTAPEALDCSHYSVCCMLAKTIY